MRAARGGRAGGKDVSGRRLDIARAPLARTTLVEAAAGTGKTWTIAALYVRLLLERRLRTADLLVLTFGRAATAELKSRIRARLVALRGLLESGDLESARESDDALVAHVARTSADPRADALWLALAVETFDQAPVYTIHSFCQRVLTEHAFESGAPFVTELAPDESALIAEVAQDFWRVELAGASPLWAQWLARAGITPDRLAADIAFLAQRPYAQVVGPGSVDLSALAAFEAAHAEAAAAWRADPSLSERFRGLFAANAYPARMRALHVLLDAEAPFPERPKDVAPFEQFTRAKLGKKAFDHPFVTAADRLWAALEPARAALAARVADLRARLAAHAREELPVRKRERGVVGYGDLILELSRALRGPRGAALAETLRQRHRAALLDEFQDTDPVQAEIFDRIYGGSEAPVYYVGDPKQAIYGFRGADVRAYLDARGRADTRLTLLTNRRSIPEQVRAVNALFARDNPFLAPDIGFESCEWHEQERPALALAQDFPAPFTFWFLPPDTGAVVGKGEAVGRVARATAAAIARLLAPGGGALGDRPLAGSDIAVLVGTHRHGAVIRRELSELGVASVTHGQDSVFATPEAAELGRVLLAVAEPGREPLVRAALATDLLGATGEDFARLAADERAWDAVLQRFAGYRDRAVTHGFIRMWRELVEAEGIPARLLRYADGERRLTNVQHLSDLLQAAAVRDGLDLDGLARYLERARAQPVEDAETEQLRLESDERLVRILTIHAAKGLEFEIVFCPFLWDGTLRSSRAAFAACHGPDGALIDTGSADFDVHLAANGEEERAERLRLAYVALTRARRRCVVAWGAVRDAGSAPLAWLVHGVRDGDLAARGEARLREDLDALVRAAPGAIAVTDLPETPGVAIAADGAAQPLAARPFAREIPAPWRVSSFSGLVARRPGVERPDHDAAAAVPPEAEEPPPRAAGAFALPRGADAGTLIHALFQHADFQRPDAPENAVLAERLLGEHGFERAWAATLARLLADVLHTPLDAAGRLRLADIVPRERKAELEFLFPVSGPPVALAPGIAAGPGFMKGYIDLVFAFEGRWYVADWKSNWLGATHADYGPERLADVMQAERYDLQSRLYAVALHRHLAARLPDYVFDTHFGGVYYLFVRGMQPANGPRTGVHFARPERGTLEQLSARFGGREGGA
jgi:exodeoxyribonuclease V beta subunit